MIHDGSAAEAEESKHSAPVADYDTTQNERASTSSTSLVSEFRHTSPTRNDCLPLQARVSSPAGDMQVGECGRSPPVNPKREECGGQPRTQKPHRRNALGFDSLVAYVVMVNKLRPDRGATQKPSDGLEWGDKHWEERSIIGSQGRPLRNGYPLGRLECISECMSVDEVTGF